MSKVATAEGTLSVVTPEIALPRTGRGGPTRLAIAVAVASAVVVGSLGGYLAYVSSHDSFSRGRAADAARWAGRAAEWQAAQQAREQTLKAREADAGRWAAMAQAYLDSLKNSPSP